MLLLKLTIHSFSLLTPPNSRQANRELTEVLNELWRLDTNRLKPGTDYRISLQVSPAQRSETGTKYANPHVMEARLVSTQQQQQMRCINRNLIYECKYPENYLLMRPFG